MPKCLYRLCHHSHGFCSTRPSSGRECCWSGSELMLHPVPQAARGFLRRQCDTRPSTVLRFDLRRESLQSNASVLNNKGIAGKLVGIVCCFRCPTMYAYSPSISRCFRATDAPGLVNSENILSNTGLIVSGPRSAPSGPKNTASVIEDLRC